MTPWYNIFRMPLESDLYAPVKALLEGQGYVVKGEVRGCDVVAVRGAEPPVVVELKRAFGLGLVLQGVDRLALTDLVYLAVGQWPKQMKNVRKLCRRLGLGFIVVSGKKADVVLDPAPYKPRPNKRKAGRMLGEHARRVGDPNLGGQAMRAPLMTAYRQEALRCAVLLDGERADEARRHAQGRRCAQRRQDPAAGRLRLVRAGRARRLCADAGGQGGTAALRPQERVGADRDFPEPLPKGQHL